MPKPPSSSSPSPAAPGTFLEAGPIGMQAAARIPSGALTVDERDEDALLGAQLTAQWERVKANRRDDLIFGAMMLRLRAHIDSARGADKRGHAKFAKGTGLKAWMEQHAPTVSESTAYRLMEIAEGISADFHLKKIDLETLLAAQLDGLDEKLAKKRAQIEEVIEGKSQRQLLLEFGKGPERGPGGKTYERDGVKGQRKRLTHAETMAVWREFIVETAERVHTITTESMFIALEVDAEIDGLAEHLETLAGKVRAWGKLTKKERAEALAEAAEAAAA